jgi:deoxycytidylate deaminase
VQSAAPTGYTVQDIAQKFTVKNLIRIKRDIQRNGLHMSRHAEEAVLAKYQKLKRRYKRVRLVVIRINALGELVESQPCSHCTELMKTMGIRKVTYSDNEGILRSEKVVNLNSQESVGFRAVSRTMTLIDDLLEYYDTHR